MVDNTNQPQEQQEPTNLEKALIIIESAIPDLKELLKEHDMIRIGFETKLNLMANQLRSLTGRSTAVQGFSTESQELKPITEFMGDPIQRQESKLVQAQEVDPNELEKRLFTQKVDKLQSEFPKLTNEQIMEAYGQLEPTVIRGVAKRAGVEEFKTMQVNGEFIDLIRQGLEANAEKLETAKKNEDLVKNAKKPSETGLPSDLEVDETDEDEEEIDEDDQQ